MERDGDDGNDDESDREGKPDRGGRGGAGRPRPREYQIISFFRDLLVILDLLRKTKEGIQLT